MRRPRQKRAAKISLALLAVLIAAPLVFTWQAVWQDHLNRALIAAIQSRQDQMALTLLQRGADAHARGARIDMFADRRPAWRLVLDLVMGPRVHQAREVSALMLAMGEYGIFRPREYSPSLPLVRALLERGTDPNEQDPGGQTPLMYAAVYNRPDLIRLMIAHGGNPNVTDDTGSLRAVFIGPAATASLMNLDGPSRRLGGGKSLLMCTCAEGNPESVKALLDGGAQINAQDERGDSALSEATMHGRVENVKVLLDHHADWRLKDESGETPLRCAKGMLHLDPDYDQQCRAIRHLLEQAGARQ